MTKWIFSILMTYTVIAHAQILKIDTLIYSGNPNKYINFVIIGDGFTSAQQATFLSNAQSVANAFVAQSPWSAYKNYINFFAIEVISTQSGAKHPNTASDCNTASPLVPVSNPTTYLGCTFDAFGIHRLIVPQNNANIASVLATNFPNYDQVIILANTPYYGGSGGTYATATLDISSNELAFHECAHSFAGLADEYYAGDSYAAEKPNMTMQTNPALVKWKNWIGVNGIGINQHCCGGNSALWYKPYTNCKMQYLNSAFCSVCKETLIEKIHSLVNVIVSYTPVALSVSSSNPSLTFRLQELMLPIPNTLKITWKLNGTVIANNIDSVVIIQNLLPNSSNSLVATVTDTTGLLKINNHATLHFSNVSWTINKIISGIKVNSSLHKSAYSLFPNPAANYISFTATSDKNDKLSVDIIDLTGKIVWHEDDNIQAGKIYQQRINIETLASGVYTFVFSTGDETNTHQFIKQ